VPVHGNRSLPVGTLRSIVRQSGISDDEFTALF
jgi:predicted RNA binding protein YcfA (HicA-like mRNA interferase family)